MKSSRSDIERLIPLLRQVARALVDRHRPDVADDLVHDAIDEIVRSERAWGAGEIETRLMTRLIGANRARARVEADERHTLPGLSARGEGPGGRSGGASAPTRGTGHGLDGLALGDREALVLVVLAGFDYPKVADILAVPVVTVIARLTHARDTLGSSLWAPTGAGAAPRARTPGPHLRLVKS